MYITAFSRPMWLWVGRDYYVYKYMLKQVTRRKTVKKRGSINTYAKEIVVFWGDKGAECVRRRSGQAAL